MSQPNQAPAGQAPADRSTEFRAVDEGEMQSGEVLLVQAYAAIWLLLFGMLILLWKKQRGLHARLDSMDKALDRLGQKAD